MENELKQRNQRNRRRERAQRMQAQRESKVKDGDSGEDESPAREKPPRPAARRKRSREPLAEEDIIDGFAIMAFRTYEDLEAAVKCASSPRTNALSTKPRLPLSALAGDAARNHPPNNVNHGITLLQDAGTSDDSGRASERLTGSSVAPRDPDSSRDRLSDASSRCSSGKGYICDSEGDDDKASPDNSRNASPRYHDASMEDVSDANALFRMTGAGGGGGGGGKNELVARGGSGGALALSRAPVGGSASPAPAPLPQPAPSPAPAALPPPALPPPPFRADTPHRAAGAANIPALDGHAATQIPARPLSAVGPETPDRPAGNKLQPGARAAADSPTPAPPAPSPLFPSHAAFQHAALPDYRHTNHETRTKPPPDPPAAAAPSPAAAPLDLHHAPRPTPPGPGPPPLLAHPPTPVSFPNHVASLANHVNGVLHSTPASSAAAAPTSLPTPALSGRPLSPAAHASRPYPIPSIGSSHINSSLSSSIHNHPIPYQSQSSLQKHSVQPVYGGRPAHLAPFSVSSHLAPAHAPASSASQPGLHLSHTINSHSTASVLAPPSTGLSSLTSTVSSFTSLKHPGLPPHAHPATSLHLPVQQTEGAAPAAGGGSAADAPTSAALPAPPNGYPPPAAYAGAAYPPLYAPYATTLQHSPYLPPSAASPRNCADTRTSLSASPLVAPKTPKGVRPHTPGSTGGAGTPLHAPHFSPRHSPSRERDSYSNLSLSRGSVTPVSSAAVVTSSAMPTIPPLTPTLAPPLAVSLAPPLAASLAAPIPTPLSSSLATPLASLSTAPLTTPLATLAAPLATPTPTAAAPTATHLAHSLAPVPTVGSISSSAKPPAHWGVTRSSAERPAGFPPPPLFGAPLAPPNPSPFSAESLFQTSPGADLLRRELDSRFLAAAGGFAVRTEMHHHQHQHTHVHQHPHAAPQPPPPPPPAPHHPHQMFVPPHPPLFKDVGKMPSLYRPGIGLGYPYSSSLLHPPTPYVPPAPLSSYAPKPVVSAASDVAPKPARPVSKTGKWNAMHVRIAWEIYNHQQKEKSAGGGSASAAPEKDKLRPFAAPAPPAPPPAAAAPPPAAAYRSPYDLPPSYLPPHHPHLGVSPFARYGASGFPGAPPPFGLSPYARELSLASSLHGVHQGPSLAALHEAWRGVPGMPGMAGVPGVRPAPAPAPLASRDQEERARREREERERDRERREREERERRKQRELDRVRQRSPLRNGEPPKEERKEAPRAPALPPYPPAAAWDPYRYDALHHMRFTPLVEAAIRAEEDRAKMLSAYAHHQQLKTSALLHRGLAPPLLGPMHAPHAPLHAPPHPSHPSHAPHAQHAQHASHAPLDLLKKEEPR